MQKTLLTGVVFCLLSFGQNDPVPMAGVQLTIGMAKSTVLSQLARDPNIRVNETSADWYLVLTKRLDLWEAAGDLTFEQGKLSRIAVNQWSTNEKAAAQLTKAVHSAVRAGGTPTEVWTAANEDALNPTYEIHVVCKDREIVISTAHVGDIDVSDVKTYFPHARAAK